MRTITLMALSLLLGLGQARTNESSPPPLTDRQDRLLREMGPAVAVVFALPFDENRPPETEDANFRYLTDLVAPGAALVLFNGTISGRESRTATLYLPRRDPSRVQWIGESPSWTGIGEEDSALAARSGVSRLRPLDELDRNIAWLLRAGDGRLLLPIPRVGLDEPLPPPLEWLRRLRDRRPDLQVEDLSPLIASLRVEKDATEIVRTRRAVTATVAAHREVASQLLTAGSEAVLDGLVLATYRRHGTRPAFPSVIGAGDRSTILHYGENDEEIPPESLVVVDIGAQFGGYSADVTRTYPTSGRFSERQLEVYRVVLEAHAAAIDAARPGRPFSAPDEAARQVVREAGLEEHFLHGTSHYLGLETHDVGDRSRDLTPGTLLTVEPGIYIADEQIGIRIEDDVLITEDGPLILSADLPVTPEEIEALVESTRP